MSGEYPRGLMELFEDFLGDNSAVLTETSTTGSQDITDKHGGWWRLTLTTGEGDIVSIGGERAWEVDEGHPLVMEVRVKSDVVASTACFIGMADTNTGVIIGNEDALAATATDAFGFMLEGEDDATWQAVAVDTDVLETAVALTNGADAVNSVIQTLRLEANPNDSGTVKYFIDGKLVSTQTGWFDSSIIYAPIVSLDARAAAVNFDIDYIYVSAPRS